MNKQVIEFLTDNPNSNKVAISEAINLKGLPLFNLLKKMVNEGEIAIEGEGNDAVYSIASSEETAEETITAPVAKENVTADNAGEANVDNQTAKTNEPPVETKTETKKQASRNTGSFDFNGASYNKGKLIHALVVAHVAKNPKITLDKLKDVFPDTLLKRFGIFQTIEKAREISGAKYDRYFFKDEMQIKLKDAVIVTSNQITSENILPFLETCSKLGYIIEAE